MTDQHLGATSLQLLLHAFDVGAAQFGPHGCKLRAIAPNQYVLGLKNSKGCPASFKRGGAKESVDAGKTHPSPDAERACPGRSSRCDGGARTAHRTGNEPANTRRGPGHHLSEPIRIRKGQKPYKRRPPLCFEQGGDRAYGVLL